MKGQEGDFLHAQGCAEPFEAALQRILSYLAAMSIGLLVISFMIMIAACIILCVPEEAPYVSVAWVVHPLGSKAYL